MQLALPAGLLRRHVRGRAQDVADAGEIGGEILGHEVVRVLLGADAAGQAPVHHQDLAELADHEVVGLEIAVHHAAAVGEGDRLGDAREAVEQAAERPPAGRLDEGAGVRGAVHLVDDGAHRPAADLLHGEPEAAVAQLALIVDRDDARVLQIGRDPRLREEAGPEVLGVAQLAALHLHGQHAVEDEVAHAPHVAEGSGRDAPEERVPRGQDDGPAGAVHARALLHEGGLERRVRGALARERLREGHRGRAAFRHGPPLSRRRLRS
ncbi:MAG: hypothetical protein QM820_31850 [Minicystis sp.]